MVDTRSKGDVGSQALPKEDGVTRNKSIKTTMGAERDNVALSRSEDAAHDPTDWTK